VLSFLRHGLNPWAAQTGPSTSRAACKVSCDQFTDIGTQTVDIPGGRPRHSRRIPDDSEQGELDHLVD